MENSSQHRLIRQRWPALARAIEGAADVGVELEVATPAQTLLVGGIHLSSSYDPVAEARLQARLIPEEAACGWVYGVGVGELPRQLLARPALRELNVVIFNLGLFRQLLAHFDLSDWLADPRLNLLSAATEGEVKAPFCVAPASLRLADEGSSRLRDSVVLELDSVYLNDRFRRSGQWQQQVEANRQRVESDRDVAELRGSRAGRRICIAATGPTLGHHFERLRQRRSQGDLIIALDASLKPLAGAGIEPDLVVAIDPIRDHLLALFDLDLAPFRNTPLVYFPVVHGDVLARWPGPRYAACSDSPLYEALMRHCPRGRLYSAGSVLHSAVDLALQMGAAEVWLLGADFAYPFGYTHVEGSVFNQSIEQLAGIDWVLSGEGRRVATTKNLRGYLRDLERYIAAHPEVVFVNGSRLGAAIAGTRSLEEVGGE